jgi:hypothetical protein
MAAIAAELIWWAIYEQTKHSITITHLYGLFLGTDDSLFVLLIFVQKVSKQKMLTLKIDSATSSRDQGMQTNFLHFPCPPLKCALLI